MANIKLIAFIILSLLACRWCEANGSGVILNGSVQDQAGAAIQNAAVTLTLEGGSTPREARSDDRGYFIFAGVMRGQYVLKASREGFISTEMHLNVGPTKPEPVRMTMSVSMMATPGASVETAVNANGAKLEKNTPGEIPTGTKKLMIVSSKTVSPVSRGVVGTSPSVDGIILNGSVQDQAGKAIQNATVTLTPEGGGAPREARSDDRGYFIFADVIPGNYVLNANAEGFASTQLSLSVGRRLRESVQVSINLRTRVKEIAVGAQGSGVSVEPASKANGVDSEKNVPGQISTERTDSVPVQSKSPSPSLGQIPTEKSDSVPAQAKSPSPSLGQIPTEKSDSIPVQPKSPSPASQVAGESSVAVGGTTVSGSVHDETGGAIPKATLTLIPKGGGPARAAKADDRGKFSFTSVKQGKYELKANAGNFQTATVSVTVGTTVPAPIQVSMKVRVQDEEVTVNAQGQGVSVSPAANTNGVKLDQLTLGQIPTDSEDIMPVLTPFLAPAAHGVAGPSIVVDGVESESLDVPTSSIKHLYLNKNPYSVRFRRPGSSRVEVTTREGHRTHYHGGFAVYGRDSAFDARNTFAQTKPDLKKMLVATNVMGPIPGLPASFYLSGERLADDESAVVNAHTLNGPFVANAPTIQNRTTLLGRFDLHPSKYHSVNAIYNFTGKSQSGLGTGGIRLPEQAYGAVHNQHSFQISDRYISLKSFINELRLRYEWTQDQSGAPAFAPAVQVAGDFIEGPSQTDQMERRSKVTVQDTIQYFTERQTWDVGAEFHPRFNRIVDASNFVGTYYFDSLTHFNEQEPLLFRFNQGRPDLNYTQHEGFGFVQDNIKLRSNLDLTLGARYEWHDGLPRGHGILPDGDVVAPRLGLAFAPFGDKTVLRAGAGLFYDEYPRQIIRQSLLFDGIGAKQLVITNPSYPDPFTGAVEPPPSVTRIANNLTVPRLMQASFAVEQALNTKTQLTVELRTLRGEHLYRSRDVNAPMPSTHVRPDPNLLDVAQVESSGILRSNSATVTLSWDASRWLSGTAQYVLSRSIDDTGGPFALPADSYNLRPELGRANFDQRHRFNLMGSAQLPWGCRLGTIVTLASGIPYNITTGKDNNKDTYLTDRPEGVSRNTGKGPGLARVDFRFTKSFDVPGPHRRVTPEQNRVTFGIDAFNAFNLTNFNNYIGVEKSHFFGQPNSALPGRAIQFSIKYQM